MTIFFFLSLRCQAHPWQLQSARGNWCCVCCATHDMPRHASLGTKLGVTRWHFVEPPVCRLWQLLGSHGGMCCGHLVASTTVRTFRWCTAYGALRAATSSLVQKLYSRRIDEPEGIRSLHLARASLSRPSLRHDSGDSYFWVL